MKVELDIYSASELRALAVFADSLADARSADETAKMAEYEKMGGLGALVGSTSDQMWRNKTYTPKDVDPVATTEVGEKIAETQATAPVTTRERGQPSPGKARRTKAEIAEDEAPTVATFVKLPDDATSEQVADAFANIKAGISTGEERVGPEDTVEDAAQDAVDEAAETAATKATKATVETPAPTLDDIRTVLGNYQKAYGLPATMEDGPKVITEVCGEGKVKVSDVPADKIAAVIEALKKAGRENRFARTPVVAS